MLIIVLCATYSKHPRGYEDAIFIPEITANNFEIKHRYVNQETKPFVARNDTSSSTQAVSSDVAELKDMVRALILDRKNQTPASAPVKAVEQSCVTCGGGHSYQNCPATNSNIYHDNIQEYVSQAAAANLTKLIPFIDPMVSSNRPPGFSSHSEIFMQIVKTISIEEITSIKTEETISTKLYFRSGTLLGNTVTTKGRFKRTLPPANNGSTEDVQPPVVQIQSRNPNPEPNVAPVVAPVVTPIPKASIPFPSRRNDERRKEKANDQIEKFYEIFRDLSFEISFTDALMLMPKFASTLKTLIGNKEKLSELARTPLNENCSAVILNKLPKKLGDPGRFLIPCEFTGITTCNALADLGASINLMPYSVWNNLSLPELTPTCMTLELADRSITKPIDPRVPLILGRCFLKTSHALIDVYEGEITLRVGKEAITFNLDQTSRYTADYNHMTVNKIDVIDMACDEYSQEVLGFSNVIASGNPTPYFEPIVSTASPNLTPFGDSDFLLFEEADSFLALEDDPTSSEVDPTYQDPEGDILLLEAILNSEPPPPEQ
ncbi:reverse transcriptase domain-containing protein [Tanacetum coccineum]